MGKRKIKRFTCQKVTMRSPVQLCYNKRMKILLTRLRRLMALLLLGLLSGCAMLGIVRRVPILEVRNEAVAAPAGTDMSAIIVRAATARRWSATVTAPDVVRCRFDARSWNIVVDVRHAGTMFSVDYVSTDGLFYRPEQHDIHGSYNRQVEALCQRIKREAMRVPAAVPSTARARAASLPQRPARPGTGSGPAAAPP